MRIKVPIAIGELFVLSKKGSMQTSLDLDTLQDLAGIEKKVYAQKRKDDKISIINA